MSTATLASPWGDFVVEEGQQAHWRLGPLERWVHNLRHEWQIRHAQGEDPLSDEVKVEQPAAADPPPDSTLLRFSFERPSTRLSLLPVLADRPFIVKPDSPLFVPTGETATLFISTPVWVRLGLEGAGRLAELPSHRPSDTWFGPNTITGELCYASRTAARLALDDVPFRPHRAVTPLKLHNKAADPLTFERVKLPVQYLSVYRAADGRLWTEALTLEREEDDDLAALDIRPSPPSFAGEVTKLGPARQSSGRNLVVRAFSRLFRNE